MENKVKKFVDSLNTGLSWDEKGNSLEIEFDDSNKFSDACVKIGNSSFVDEIDDLSEINLEGAVFRWNGYGDDEEVYNIQATGDFVNDKYVIKVWLD